MVVIGINNHHFVFYCSFITEDSYWGDVRDPLRLNLYTYCYNNPIMYINPTGNIVTAWDKERCTPEEVERLEELTTIAESGGNVTEAHSEAEGIREHYRDDDEYGTGDGNTGAPFGVYHPVYWAGDDSTLEQGYESPLTGRIVDKEQYDREQKEYQQAVDLVTGLYGGVIKGFTKHGLSRVLGRDRGLWVSNKAILNAVNNPSKIVKQDDSKIKYILKMLQ